MPSKRKVRAHRKPLKKNISWVWRILIYLSLTSSLALIAYCFYLDATVRQQFEGKRFALPARVYARPLELFTGKPITPEFLVRELEILGFRLQTRLSSPGDYFKSAEQIHFYARDFQFWDGIQPQQKISVTFNAGGWIESIDNLTLQTKLDLFRLEPLSIGGIYTSQNEDRQLVRYTQVPRHFIDALIAVEDKRFYQHHGIDPRGLLRAFISTASGKGLQGGSTLTQQLVKNFFLTPERTLKRKLNEMLMALLLELHYDKNDILETYINEVYFGQDGKRSINGLGLASAYFFGVPVERLKPHQSALLVAMLKGPGVYNPHIHPDRALERRNLVLAETGQQGYLLPHEFERAIQLPLDIIPKQAAGLSRYSAFLTLVFRQLRRDYQEADLRSEGLRVFSTLDPQLQLQGELSVKTQLPKLEQQAKLKSHWLNAALISSVPHTGEITALVGGWDTKGEGFNRVLDAKRPIGSLIKPAIYLTALNQYDLYTLSTPLDDTPLKWEQKGMDKPWQPQNYDKKFHGTPPLWQALANSYNVSTVRLGLALGLPAVIKTAQALGLQEAIPAYGATLLGAVDIPPIQVAQMYQTLASGGFKMPLTAIREVTTQEGTLLKRYPIRGEQVISPQAVFLVNRGMQLAVSMGTAKSLNQFISPNLNVAGKTGTTDDLRDSWFAGFSSDHLTVVWVGNDDNQPTGLTGATGALKVWGHFMAAVKPEPYNPPLPEDIQMFSMHPNLNTHLEANCPQAITLPFVLGSEPTELSECDINNSPSIFKRWFGQ